MRDNGLQQEASQPAYPQDAANAPLTNYKSATLAPEPDPRLVIRAVPGGFIIEEDWGAKQSVAPTVAKVVAAVRAKWPTPEKAKK